MGPNKPSDTGNKTAHMSSSATYLCCRERDHKPVNKLKIRIRRLKDRKISTVSDARVCIPHDQHLTAKKANSLPVRLIQREEKRMRGRKSGANAAKQGPRRRRPANAPVNSRAQRHQQYIRLRGSRESSRTTRKPLASSKAYISGT